MILTDGNETVAQYKTHLPLRREAELMELILLPAIG